MCLKKYHLLIGRQVWLACLNRGGWQGVAPLREEQIAGWWMCAWKSVVIKARRNAFDSFVILIAWLL
jgi:hypothetical protein